MATSRYDQRKNYEEAVEANAIGTEYVSRADLLPPANAGDHPDVAAELPRSCRVLFYMTHDEQELQQNNSIVRNCGIELRSAIRAPAMEQPTPVMSLVVSGA